MADGEAPSGDPVLSRDLLRPGAQAAHACVRLQPLHLCHEGGEGASLPMLPMPRNP